MIKTSAQFVHALNSENQNNPNDATTTPLNQMEMAFKSRLERDMYLPALEFLNLQSGTCAWRHNNDAVWIQKIGRYVRRSCHQDGIADLIGVKGGKAFAFEVKRAGLLRTVDQTQRAWMQRFVDCGGIGYFVDDVSDIINAFPEI